MNNKVKILIVLVVVLFIVLILALFGDKMKKDSYSVVYLSTGEVYVGKLSTFPRFELKNGYILQVTKDTTDPSKNNFQLNPVSDAIWAPQELNFVKENVVFYGKLSVSSKIAETIAAQAK